MRRIDDVHAVELDIKRLGEVDDPIARADENGNDHSRFGRLQGTSQRAFVASVRNGRHQGLEALGRRYQPLVLRVLSELSNDSLLAHGAGLGRLAGFSAVDYLTTSSRGRPH